MTPSTLPVLLHLVPFVGALLAAGGGWLLPGAARPVALATLAATGALSVAAFRTVLLEGTLTAHLGGWPPPYGIEVLLDPLSAFIALLVGVVAPLVVAGALSHLRAELPGRETSWFACVLLLVSGLLGMVVAADLFNLFVQLEVASLAAYALVAAGGRGAPRAGFRYLILGSFGASLYLLGVAFLFAATGSLNMADVARLASEAEPRLVTVGGLLVVGGLGVKMALFPLHTWMPSAYARAPAASAALMAPLVTKVSAYALLRILYGVLGAGASPPQRLFLEVLALAGAAAILAGGLLALLEQDLRRLLAYSSVAQMGVVALGLGLADAAGLRGAVLHIASDALLKAVLFLAAGTALLRYGVRRLDELGRLRGRAPWTRAAVAVAGLSLVGIPPLSGFFGKWYVLSGALAGERWFLAAALLAGSLLSAGYVFRLFERLFFASEPPGPSNLAPPDEAGSRLPRSVEATACVVLAALVILLGVGNERVVSLVVLPAIPGGAP